jgi:zinc transport system substrate-binding protein
MNTKRLLILFLSILCFIGGGSCFFSESKRATTIKIMASIFPLKEFSQAVVGNRGEVDLLLPPGAEIHAWQPKPSDLVKLSNADVFVYIGAKLEPWADDIIRSVKNPDLHVIEASLNLPLIGHEVEGENHSHDSAGGDKQDAGDPHIWLDFANDKKIIDRITEVLVQIEPASRTVFLENAGVYKQKLDSLDDKYWKGLEQCDQKTIVLGGHAAFGYLARRYHLSQISLYGLNPDSEPTPRQLIHVVDFVREKDISAIFFEINISSQLARVIAKETGARVLVLNPGASLPKEQDHTRITFLSMMEKNLENLKNGLGCR